MTQTDEHTATNPIATFTRLASNAECHLSFTYLDRAATRQAPWRGRERPTPMSNGGRLRHGFTSSRVVLLVVFFFHPFGPGRARSPWFGLPAIAHVSKSAH